jgi:hypothetical protein
MHTQKIFVDLTQPPPVYIPPGFNGQITMLNHNDVLCGRGCAISYYSGNIQLRAFAVTRRAEYIEHSMKIEKAYICAQIVADIRSLSPPGRFLERDENQFCWIEIGDVRARKKVAQVLRESTTDRQERRRTDRCRFPTDFEYLMPPVREAHEADISREYLSDQDVRFSQLPSEVPAFEGDQKCNAMEGRKSKVISAKDFATATPNQTITEVRNGTEKSSLCTPCSNSAGSSTSTDYCCSDVSSFTVSADIFDIASITTDVFDTDLESITSCSLK